MQDEIKRFLAYDGRVSVICAVTTNLVEKARNTHDLSPLATATMGRVLTMGAIMGIELKGSKDKLTIQLKGNGPIGTIIVTANSFPKVKGAIGNPQVDLPLNEDGKLDVGRAIGREGYLNIVKDMGLKEPYVGISPLVSGEIAEDFAEYFSKSEQKNSAVALGVLVDKNGVRSAGGYLITPMPDATEDDIYNLEQSIFKAGAISKMLDKDLSLEEIAKNITGDENIQVIEENRTPLYECDCSKEHMAEALVTIGKEELTNIIEEDGEAELVCHFCNKRYHFNQRELFEILEAAERN